MGVEEIRIPVGEGAVTASVHGAGPTVVILGHGAGSDRRSPRLLDLAAALAASGRRTLLYNFPYRERGGRAPDPAPILESTTRAVGEYARGPLGAARLVQGGRSMGGRIASQAVALGAPADGLVFLGYPLHPPGRPNLLRDRHLPRITVPMLFVQGTRDTFARSDLLEATLVRLGELATLHRVEGGDHSFAVRKRSGRVPEDVRAEVEGAVLGWLRAHGL
jgi:predicted alpha/beta-hydrolase family hydrolase